MKRLLYSSLVLSALALASFGTSAQPKHSLPGKLNENSSVSEILTWLDHTTFRNVRIVLKDSSDAFTYRPPWDDSGPAKHTFIFTQGFRVTNIDGCNLMLRNDDARTVYKSKVDEPKHRLVADLWLQLNRMSPNKGKRAHRYTKDAEKARLLGAWRTEFKYRGWFARTMFGLTLHSPEWKEPERWEGSDVAFSFDTKELSEEFDAAFRRAIRLCQI